MSKTEKSASRSEALGSQFKCAVEATPDVAGGFRPGLRAMEGKDKDAVRVTDPQKVDGSLNIDRSTKNLYPQEPRWDYAVGYDGKVCYVEVHPANTSNIPEVLKKKDWLAAWLKSRASQLDRLPAGCPKFLWAATEAGVHISRQSSYGRKLAQLGLVPRRPVVIG